MKNLEKIVIAIFAMALTVSGCTSGTGEVADNTLTKKEIKDGWELLFDGETFTNWRGVGRDAVQPDHWKVEDGMIRKVNSNEVPLNPDGSRINGGDIMTVEKFENFEFSFEWKIKPEGNSGIKYNVSEEISTSHGNPCGALGFEYQILDDAAEKYSKLMPTQYTACLYEMYKAENVQTNPVGEWNSSRILVDGNHAEHWLNGVKVLEYEYGTAEFDSLYQKSKYHIYPDFEKKRAGHIVITNHSDDSWYKNIKIRKIERK